jgi:hypothetical protein
MPDDPTERRTGNVRVNPGRTMGDAEGITWSEETGQDFIRNNAIEEVDFATLHLW